MLYIIVYTNYCRYYYSMEISFKKIILSLSDCVFIFTFFHLMKSNNSCECAFQPKFSDKKSGPWAKFVGIQYMFWTAKNRTGYHLCSRFRKNKKFSSRMRNYFRVANRPFQLRASFSKKMRIRSQKNFDFRFEFSTFFLVLRQSFMLLVLKLLIL